MAMFFLSALDSFTHYTSELYAIKPQAVDTFTTNTSQTKKQAQKREGTKKDIF
jgi:hypothetical protein